MKYGIAILLLLSSTVYGQDWFVGAELGRASTDAPNFSIPMEVGDGDLVRVDDSDTGFSINLGYHFDDNWSVAVGYVDLGEGSLVVEGDTLTPDTFAQAVTQTPVLANGFTLSAIYQVYSQDDIYVDVEAGLFRWDADFDSTSNLGTISSDDQSTDVMWGATVGYAFTPEWRLNISYRAYELEERVSFPNIGVRYSF